MREGDYSLRVRLSRPGETGNTIAAIPFEILPPWYRTWPAYGLYAIAPMSRVNLAFKKTFLKDKLDLNLSLSDIFKGQRIKFETRINGNVNDFNQYFRSRIIGATLRYNFSKGQKVDVKRRNTVEEVNRTGG